jgi:hypothetical protein
MLFTIDVKDAEEGEQIRAGLNNPEARAVVIAAGILDALPDTRSRGRVLNWAADFLDQQEQERQARTGSIMGVPIPADPPGAAAG